MCDAFKIVHRSKFLALYLCIKKEERLKYLNFNLKNLNAVWIKALKTKESKNKSRKEQNRKKVR